MKHLRIFFALAAIAALVSSCHDRKSYAELLTDENHACNSFLADQHVIPYDAQRDSTFNFEVGPNAPYYELDPEGNLYMQVLNTGNKGQYAEDDQLIYFRFTRYNLLGYANGTLPEGSGNDSDMTSGSASFRFNNYSLQVSYQWGTGLQKPLEYLPLGCEVNIVIKSQYGLQSEISSVVPYLYNVRYFKSQI